MPAPTINIHDLCDRALASIEAERWVEAYLTLMPGLRYIRAHSDGPGWSAAVAQARAHGLGERLRREPVTRRAADKPRGYPGDAVLLDLLYFEDGPRFEAGREDGPDDTIRGGFIFPGAASTGVRHRRELLGRAVDDAAERNAGAVMLSVACGHLREFELTTLAKAPILTNSVGGGGSAKPRWIAFDQDPESLAVVAREYAPSGLVEPVEGSVRDLLKGRTFDARFDLVYAAGLYDYLEQPVARRLTAALFDHLAPGGRLLVANFLPDHLDVGYMEAFMDWWLLYRTPAELADVAADISPDRIAAVHQWNDPWDAITYLELERA